MLRFLGVRNLAVIDRLEVEFEPGLTILTGETGAGKSIVIEAIDLLTGGRASADLVPTGEETAVVQAVFDRADGREVIVRREISAEGRSRAFIDDTLATIAALRELGTELVDLHGQHAHQTLLDPSEHLSHLDASINVSGDTSTSGGSLIENVAADFQHWRTTAAALERSTLDDREKRARTEIATFQLQEIEHVAPKTGEDAELEAERSVLLNADRLLRLSNEAYAALYEGDASVLASLSAIWKRVTELAAIDARFLPYAEARAGVKAGLEDLAFFLQGYASDLEASPDRLQAVEDRLAAIERIKRKHGPTLDDVLRRQQDLRDELAALGASGERAAALEAEERVARDRFLERAKALSNVRQQAAVVLARALERALAELAMPNSRVDVRVTPIAESREWSSAGTDRVEFFLSANPGEDLRPLARIASGGELSRIMLALRTLVTRAERGRTLIFDEVDAGIGGAAADAVGVRLQGLARRDQVFCITHLPQIAARASTHLHIAKQLRAGRTSTTFTKLDAAGRELEIARMIAGAEVTPQVVASARELIRTRSESEIKAKGESPMPVKAKGRRRDA